MGKAKTASPPKKAPKAKPKKQSYAERELERRREVWKHQLPLLERLWACFEGPSIPRSVLRERGPKLPKVKNSNYNIFFGKDAVELALKEGVLCGPDEYRDRKGSIPLVRGWAPREAMLRARISDYLVGRSGVREFDGDRWTPAELPELLELLKLDDAPGEGEAKLWAWARLFPGLAILGPVDARWSQGWVLDEDRDLFGSLLGVAPEAVTIEAIRAWRLTVKAPWEMFAEMPILRPATACPVPKPDRQLRLIEDLEPEDLASELRHLGVLVKDKAAEIAKAEKSVGLNDLRGELGALKARVRKIKERITSKALAGAGVGS